MTIVVPKEGGRRPQAGGAEDYGREAFLMCCGKEGDVTRRCEEEDVGCGCEA